jgi:DNA-binding LacI/PurR family transcriptional regulator
MVPALSTVHFDTATLGRHFANLALNKVDGRPLPSLAPPSSATLLHREST